MYFQRIFTPGLAIHSYLLGDEKTKRAVVIDPVRQVVPYIMLAQNGGYEITHILETHVHADFISGAKELKHQLNERPQIYASGIGGKEWEPAYADEIVHDRQDIVIGDLRLRALHTPGHTPEHIMWVCYDNSRSTEVPEFAFTGDCLFVGSVGRPDLLGEKSKETQASHLYHTLFDRLDWLPEYVEIFPAHGAGSLCGKALKAVGSSTMGYERLTNPYLKNLPEELWIKNLNCNPLPIPPYFQKVKRMNRDGAPLLNTLNVKKWEEEIPLPNLESLFLLDIRLPETFASSHIKGAINISASETFAQWAGWMIPSDIPIGLVTESYHLISDIIDQLRLMGFDQEIWIIPFDKLQQRYPLSTFRMMDVEELQNLKSANAAPNIVDVRTTEEWVSGHIDGAQHFELNTLKEKYPQLPKDRSIALICRSGHRASLAASLLEKEGFQVMNVRGGIQAWRQAGLPLKMEKA